MTKITKLLPVAPLLFMTGCMGPGTMAKNAKFHQTVILNANTPWGPQRYVGLNTNTTVIVSPDGTLTINPQRQLNESESVTVAPVTELQVIRAKK